jgi:hypothetical protein
LNTKPNGVRRVERQKLRWEYGIDQDMRILTVKNWTSTEMNGQSFLTGPGPNKGCRANDDDDDDESCTSIIEIKYSGINIVKITSLMV